MSRRLKITLPDPICEQLSDMAASSGEPVSRLAAQIVRSRVVEAAEGHTRCYRSRRLTAERPDWLEPLADGRAWRASMWEEIEALYLRYQHALSGLVDGWWADESCVEMLCAMATWRRAIDESGHDPTEELDFQARLLECSTALRRAADPDARSWIPGVSPHAWDRRPRHRSKPERPDSLPAYAELSRCAR